MAKKNFSRSDRVADQIQRELAEILQKGLKDPRVGWVTITAVEVTRDYSHAKIYYTVMVDSTREATVEALADAAGYLRAELGKRISLFSMPQLHFVYDESIERGVYMTRLIDEVVQAGDKAAADDQGSANADESEVDDAAAGDAESAASESEDKE
ncbi:30S ribosome-binding factor RbfA [Crenobacter cavernae]|uniref:Ribosome-binding factor A n=1 Tax=Crenobacter cavernae TaxID=2290923 RepID=A0A345Y924_9NEIS|nr:30S ribosome-binding factor RbfA [Crenobacter cavernae]AXK40426.1 30S ribosome-binding factor RbfA [Crenobacter cavernae]